MMRIAKRIEEVLSVLEFAEDEARSGSYVAVMLSYEAAPAFDSALVAPRAFRVSARLGRESLQMTPNSRVARESRLFRTSWSPRVERDEYDRAVARIRELIAAGDTYQVNYSFPLTSSSAETRTSCIATSVWRRARLTLPTWTSDVSRCSACRQNYFLSAAEITSLPGR